MTFQTILGALLAPLLLLSAFSPAAAADPVYCTAAATFSSYVISIDRARFHGGRAFDTGDEICIRDGEMLVGGVAWDGSGFPLAALAWRNDFHTPVVDGCICGHPIGCTAYDASTGEELPLKAAVWLEGDGTFCDGDGATVRLRFDLRHDAAISDGGHGSEGPRDDVATGIPEAPVDRSASWGTLKTLFR